MASASGGDAWNDLSVDAIMTVINNQFNEKKSKLLEQIHKLEEENKGLKETLAITKQQHEEKIASVKQELEKKDKEKEALYKELGEFSMRSKRSFLEASEYKEKLGKSEKEVTSLKNQLENTVEKVLSLSCNLNNVVKEKKELEAKVDRTEHSRQALQQNVENISKKCDKLEHELKELTSKLAAETQEKNRIAEACKQMNNRYEEVKKQMTLKLAEKEEERQRSLHENEDLKEQCSELKQKLALWDAEREKVVKLEQVKEELYKRAGESGKAYKNALINHKKFMKEVEEKEKKYAEEIEKLKRECEILKDQNKQESNAAKFKKKRDSLRKMSETSEKGMNTDEVCGPSSLDMSVQADIPGAEVCEFATSPIPWNEPPAERELCVPADGLPTQVFPGSDRRVMCIPNMSLNCIMYEGSGLKAIFDVDETSFRIIPPSRTSHSDADGDSKSERSASRSVKRKSCDSDSIRSLEPDRKHSRMSNETASSPLPSSSSSRAVSSPSYSTSTEVSDEETEIVSSPTQASERGSSESCDTTKESCREEFLKQLNRLKKLNHEFRDKRFVTCRQMLPIDLAGLLKHDDIDYAIETTTEFLLSRAERIPLAVPKNPEVLMMPPAEWCIAKAYVKCHFDFGKHILYRLLHHIRSILHRQEKVTMYGYGAMCQVYVCLAKIISSTARVKSFFFEVLRFVTDIAPYLAACMAAVIPEAFDFYTGYETELLGKILSYVLYQQPANIDDTTWGECKEIFKRLCNLHDNSSQTPEELLDDLLLEIDSRSTSTPFSAALTEQYHQAFEVLAVHQGSAWAHSEIIEKRLNPYMADCKRHPHKKHSAALRVLTQFSEKANQMIEQTAVDDWSNDDEAANADDTGSYPVGAVILSMFDPVFHAAEEQE